MVGSYPQNLLYSKDVPLTKDNNFILSNVGPSVYVHFPFFLLLNRFDESCKQYICLANAEQYV